MVGVVMGSGTFSWGVGALLGKSVGCVVGGMFVAVPIRVGKWEGCLVGEREGAFVLTTASHRTDFWFTLHLTLFRTTFLNPSDPHLCFTKVAKSFPVPPPCGQHEVLLTEMVMIKSTFHLKRPGYSSVASIVNWWILSSGTSRYCEQVTFIMMASSLVGLASPYMLKVVTTVAVSLAVGVIVGCEMVVFIAEVVFVWLFDIIVVVGWVEEWPAAWTEGDRVGAWLRELLKDSVAIGVGNQVGNQDGGDVSEEAPGVAAVVETMEGLVVGRDDGLEEGMEVGNGTGWNESSPEAAALGFEVGAEEDGGEVTVGRFVGLKEGVSLGNAVGLALSVGEADGDRVKVGAFDTVGEWVTDGGGDGEGDGAQDGGNENRGLWPAVGWVNNTIVTRWSKIISRVCMVSEKWLHRDNTFPIFQFLWSSWRTSNHKIMRQCQMNVSDMGAKGRHIHRQSCHFCQQWRATMVLLLKILCRLSKQQQQEIWRRGNRVWRITWKH
jgi:hypothetical protein